MGIEAAQDGSCKENAPEVYEKMPVASFERQIPSRMQIRKDVCRG
jgi:hypothetical protein